MAVSVPSGGREPVADEGEAASETLVESERPGRHGDC